MSQLATVDALLWALAALGTLWAFGPPLCSVLGLSKFRCTAAADPRAAEPPGDDPDYEHKYRQLFDLGFRPVGVLTEHNWLFGFHWYKPFPIRCLATPGGDCHAGLYRLAGEPLRVKFDSFTSGGYAVRTVGPGVDAEDRDEHLCRTEVAGASVHELYERHRQVLREVASGRGETVLGATLGDLARIDPAQEKERIGGLWLAPFLILPGLFFLVPGLVVVLVGYLGWGAGALTRACAVALCLGTLAYLVFLKVLFPIAVRQELARANPA